MKKASVIKILISIILVTILSGCSFIEKIFNPDEIKIKEIFTQKEDTYYIYFYKEDCPYCEAVQEVINQIEESEEILYKVNLSLDENKLIGRSYSNGEGSNNKYHVTQVKDYQELYISIVPTIIKIVTNEETRQKEAIYIAGGLTEIFDYYSN